MRDSKSQPESRKTVEPPERAKDHNWQINAQSDCTDFGFNVCEGFIDDQPSTALPQLRRSARQRRAGGHASVGIIGIHDHGMADRFGKIFGQQLFSRAQDDCAFDSVLELAYVARPVVAHQARPGLGRDARHPSIAFVRVLHREIAGQQGNVLRALAQ